MHSKIAVKLEKNATLYYHSLIIRLLEYNHVFRPKCFIPVLPLSPDY